MIRRFLAGILFAALSCWAQTPASIELLPGDITLSGPEASHQVIVQGRFAGDRERDVTAAAAFEAADPRIVHIEGGVARPRGNGRTRLTASVGGATSSIEVTVEGFEAPVVPSFLNDVQPVLTKAGCNSGACHGSEAGKNGFKLSLRGYDSEFDHAVLTREAGGRRVARWDPSKSLLLLKPTLTIPHNGGKRFAVDSPDFRILADWIANGAPPPATGDVKIEDLRVFPEQAWLENNAEQQVIVQAEYSDGSQRDVTRWAKFSSTNSGVATVDDLGRVKMQGPGEAAITVWYSSKVKFARVGIPFGHDIDPKVYSEAPRKNYIDDLVIEKLKALHIAPSEPVGDTAFLRRAYLDAMGALPSPAEVERFEADPSPDKRERLIDAILEREEFVDYWAYKWSDLLLVSSRDLGDTAMWSYYRWIRESVEKNTPWDRLVRQVLTSTGNSSIKGELNYYQLHRNTIELAENVTQAFLGLRITCARCHNHPLEKWTQNDYYPVRQSCVARGSEERDGRGRCCRLSQPDRRYQSSEAGQAVAAASFGRGGTSPRQR